MLQLPELQATYLNRSVLASTRLCANHIIILLLALTLQLPELQSVPAAGARREVSLPHGEAPDLHAADARPHQA